MFLKKHWKKVIFLLLAASFSFWLMFSTFSYSEGEMLIATKVWSDFASQIPLIRSFSFGDNFPPQFPLFPGPPIHYHFLFYLFIGFLEKTGLQINYALNIPSSIGFFGLIVIIFYFARQLFKSTFAAFLSVIFFLFNGTLSFVYFFLDNPSLSDVFTNIVSNTKFPSFGPYDDRIVSAFWNLNIYTNQRHLGLSYAIALFIIFIFILPVFSKLKPKMKTYLFLGVLLGATFFLHFAVFLMTVIVILLSLFLFPKVRKYGILTVILAAVISFPQFLYLQQGESVFKPFFNPGYLISNNLTFTSFIDYWFSNLGFHFIFIPLGFVLSPRKVKKVFLIFFSFFILGNLIQFSPEAASNHKFFNFFMLVGVMFSAYFLSLLWQSKKTGIKTLVVIFIFLLTLSGLIDFFPVYNDKKIVLVDYPKNSDIQWIIENTPKDATFLNSNFLYEPASLAGRKIFLGWPYFAWSAGYDTNQRDQLRKKILSSQNNKFICDQINKNNLEYISIFANSDVNTSFIERTLQPIYQNKNNSYKIYKIKNICNE